MAASNEQAYREMLTLLHNESRVTDELAPIDGDTDEMADGRMTADSLCSSALLLIADPDQVRSKATNSFLNTPILAYKYIAFLMTIYLVF